MEFQNLNVQAIAAELGMKDLIIIELQARIKQLEETVKALSDAVPVNGKVEDTEGAKKTLATS